MNEEDNPSLLDSSNTSLQHKTEEEEIKRPPSPTSPTQGVLTKTVSILDEARNGNFLPALVLLKNHPELKLNVIDSKGYSLVHYAVCLGHLQVNFPHPGFEAVSRTRQGVLEDPLQERPGLLDDRGKLQQRPNHLVHPGEVTQP